MSIIDIRALLEVLTQAAQERRLMCVADFACVVGGADIDFMTHGERAERHSLLMMLPTQFEEAQAARVRIQFRIAERKKALAHAVA